MPSQNGSEGIMRQMTVTLNIVTPLFLGGADPNSAPELRVPSFRGVLRYWLRAALGGALGDQDMNSLRKAEAFVFGDTNNSSPIEIRLSYSRLSHMGYNPLPHKAKRFQFDGFNPDQTFSISLVGRQVTAASWRAAIDALLLAVRLGGMGRRSRRGFGSLCLKHVDISQAQLSDPWSELLGQVPNSVSEWEQHLKAVLGATEAEATDLAENLGLSNFSPLSSPTFPILSPKNNIMLCHHVFSDWEDALKTFGRAEHVFLSRNPGRAQAFGSANPRWASPLWVRVLPTKCGVILALTLIWSQPPPRLHANESDLRTFVLDFGRKWGGKWIV